MQLMASGFTNKLLIVVKLQTNPKLNKRKSLRNINANLSITKVLSSGMGGKAVSRKTRKVKQISLLMLLKPPYARKEQLKDKTN